MDVGFAGWKKSYRGSSVVKWTSDVYQNDVPRIGWGPQIHRFQRVISWPKWWRKPLLTAKHVSLLLPPCNSYLETPKAASPRQSDIADVRRAVGGNHLINHQSPILQVCPTGLLHLPEFLKCLHHVHYRKRSSEVQQGVVLCFKTASAPCTYIKSLTRLSSLSPLKNI